MLEIWPDKYEFCVEIEIFLEMTTKEGTSEILPLYLNGFFY